jgi:hypothetical protein
MSSGGSGFETTESPLLFDTYARKTGVQPELPILVRICCMYLGNQIKIRSAVIV